MKFLHLGDLHLGRSLGDFDLIEDQRYMLDRILEILKESQADAVFIAGDVYDKSIPSEAAVRLLDRFLGRLAEMRIKTFLISGNHDSDDRLNFGSRFFEAGGIQICARFDGKMGHYVLTDEYGPVHIWMLPFVKASRVRYYYPEAEINSYEDAVRTVLEHAGIDPNERNLLIAHQFVSGAADPQLAGSEGAAVQNVGLVEKIGAGIFKDFEYVALGHIHSPQPAGAEQIRYSGSLLKYSLSEAGNAKSAPLVTIGPKKNLPGESGISCPVEIELIPLKPQRDLRRLRGPLNQLLNPANVTDTDDYIYATLTDEEPVQDAMGIFRQYYPNTVRIDYDNAHTKEAIREGLAEQTANKSFTELISDFYRQMYGCEISSEELVIMLEAAEAAGMPVPAEGRREL